MKPRHAILLLAAGLFLWNLWGHDLWAPDEPYFAEGAREMLVDGKWIVPHVNGVVTTDKPPLFFWLISLLSWPLGGVSSFTARLPSVLAALGTVALTIRLGRRFSDGPTATLAGFVLCTLYMFWEKARWAQIDATLCFLIWVALSAFEAFRAGDASGRRAGVLFWFAAALAVLAKGPVGLLLPLGIALVVLAVDRNLRSWARFAPLLGPLAFVAITGAWIAVATLAGPSEYSVLGALKEHFVDRGVRGMHHKQPFWYYLEVLPVYLMPWIGVIPGALWLAGRRRAAADRFLLVAALFVVVFFSISTEKRELYVLPAYPAFALLAARFMGQLLGLHGAGPRPSGEAWLVRGQAAVAAVLAVVGLALPFAARSYEQAPYGLALALAAVFLVTACITWLYIARRRRWAAALSPAVGFVVAYLLAATFLFPSLDSVKSGRAFALTIKEVSGAADQAGGRVMAFDLGNLPETFSFYSDGVYTVETEELRRLVEHLGNEREVYAVVNGRAMERLPPEIRQRVRVLADTRLARRDVLLVTNR